MKRATRVMIAAALTLAIATPALAQTAPPALADPEGAIVDELVVVARVVGPA